MDEKQQARKLNYIQQIAGSVYKEFFDSFKNDPLNNCTLFLEEGCAHIDGILCDFPNCSMNKDYIEKKRLEKDWNNMGCE